MNAFEIVRRPKLTEKSVHLQNKLGTYTFEVHPKANKVQIREAVEQLFSVKVAKVATMNCRGKRRRTRLSVGTTPAWKKAYVTLADGQSIEGI